MNTDLINTTRTRKNKKIKKKNETKIMDQFRNINIFLGVSLLLFEFGYNVSGYLNDFPGPYCETRLNGCCDSRQDDCAVPIAGKTRQNKKRKMINGMKINKIEKRYELFFFLICNANNRHTMLL